MKGKQTTGARISELGVRTVLAMNLLTENHVPAAERNAHLARVEQIAKGNAGVSAGKVAARSLERCASGRWN